ncbi:uncharacterized protein LOC131619364 [Vicia villosa]|uniref:uncharacterized protein LOC131619364 n=1 Tax=Vicia villosa TaxID=3911 RepID=UPI00273C057D|nr:uncharacterized protein LOC131619364 [Vicia villosa]
MDLVDLPTIGGKFTWFKSNEKVMSRLDRFLLSDSFIKEWKVNGQHIGDRDISDHAPIWLKDSRKNWGPKPFKFNNLWFKHEEFDTFVKEEWSKMTMKGRGDYYLVEKLKTLKSRISWWNKTVYGWIDLKIDKDGKELHFLDNLFVYFASNAPEEVVKKRLKVAEDFWDNLNKKERLLRIKSRQLWLTEGDDNTCFFHNSLKYRRRRNSLCSINSTRGILEEVMEIKDHIFKHFEGFFKEEFCFRLVPHGINLNSLSIEESMDLEKPFSEEEVKEVIWSCDGNKSLGPDGYSLEFFKRFWLLLKDDLMKLCNDFYSRGTLVKAITSSFLALIPKSKNPQDLFEYHPIFLVGSIYKIFAKILVARMRGVAGKLVSLNQTAFVLGRSIMDGVLMGFGMRWMKWMESCIFTSHMSILVNGSATKEFSVQRGLLQGDPISPFLFVIAMEGLSALKKRGTFPFKFLGIWVEEGASKRRVWKDVVSNIKSRLSMWKGRNISIGGRVTLIGSVLNAILIYTLSFFKAPSKIIQEIRGLLSNFLWNGNVNKRCIHWVKWENVCKPKEKGGLGIRDVVLASCVEVLNRDDSSWWRDIILNASKEEDFVEGFIDWVNFDFKKGNTVLFWHSCWLGDQTLCVSFPYLFDLSTNKLCKVSDVISWNNGAHSWNLDVLFGNLPVTNGIASAFDIQLRDLKALLDGIVPNILDHDDFHWKLNPTGVFSVASVSHLVSNTKDLAWPINTINLLVVIWKAIILKKVKIFSWRFFINRLPLEDLLANRGVPNLNSLDCLFCSHQPETLEHLFFQCQVTKVVWDKIYAWLGNDFELNLEEFKRFGRIQEKVREANSIVILNSIWIARIWCIWLMRNVIVFYNATFSFEAVISNIFFFSWRWLSSSTVTSRTSFYDWYKLPLNCFKSI